MIFGLLGRFLMLISAPAAVFPHAQAPVSVRRLRRLTDSRRSSRFQLLVEQVGRAAISRGSGDDYAGGILYTRELPLEAGDVLCLRHLARWSFHGLMPYPFHLRRVGRSKFD